jgi:hypothetical protein
MNRFTSLLWKEWRGAQAYLWIGLGLFLLLPIVGGLEEVVVNGHRFELWTSPWVVALGGVLAVLAAVGVTTPDLRPKVADFWRSRPIGVGPWMAVKYAVALAAVLVACAVPLGAEMAFGHQVDSSDPVWLAFLPFFWTAVFSLAFLAACLIDRPAHAAVLGLAALLLAYLLPVVVPPLAWLNVADLSDVFVDRTGNSAHVHLVGVRQAVFAGGMLAVSAAAVAVATVGVRRGWRVESGRKLLYGLVATALLLLFASAAFQLGSNLPVLATATLPADESISYIGQVDPGEYVVVTTENWPPGTWRPGYNAPVNHYRYRPLHLGAAEMSVGPPSAWVGGDMGYLLAPWQRNRHGFGYYVDWKPVAGVPVDQDEQHDLSLVVTDVRQLRNVRSIPLWRGRHGNGDDGAELFLWADKLYLTSNRRLIVYDLADPALPRVVSEGPLPDWWERLPTAPGQVRKELIPLPGVPPIGRLEATLRYTNFDVGSRVMCEWLEKKRDALVGYRLSTFTDTTATFDTIGEYRPTLLQRLVNGYYGSSVQVSDGLAYVFGFGSRAFNSSIMVLDTRGPRPMRPVGHFAAPGAQTVLPLPDGRAIVGGANHLWLVGPPPRRGGE